MVILAYRNAAPVWEAEAQSTGAKAAQSHLWLFIKPRSHAWMNPKTRFYIRNGCSTLALTLDWVRF
jgi:hypothetical protein